jgi:prepilin-type processing-associated H-X9-DG protein
MMPALARVREQARSVASMSNLKQIGLALIMYADEHQGNLPASLEDAKSYYGNAKILESPHKPKDFSGPSYLYVSGQAVAGDYHNIVVYENPGFCKDKINVLFLDGHVEALTPEAFQRELQATYERLGRKMPDAGFPDKEEVAPPAPKAVGPSKA